MAMELKRVEMKDVPAPPAGVNRGKWVPLYEAVAALPKGQTHAIRVQFEGKQKEFSAAKTAIKILAKRSGKRILSSRNAEGSLGWFWWIGEGEIG